MRLIIGNVKSQAVFGGADYLHEENPNSLLKDYLKVRPLGYAHSPSYRGNRNSSSKGKWDGWTYLVNTKNEFATGFVPMVAKYFESMGYEIKVEDNRNAVAPEYPPLEDFTDSLPNGWTLYDLQYDALKKLLFNKVTIGGVELPFQRGIIDAATNSGKTSIIASLFYNMTSGKLLFLIHRQKLFKQQFEFFQSLFGSQVGQVNDRHMELDKPFVCAMYQTLLNRAEKSLDVRTKLGEFGVLVVDETHTAGASGYVELLSMIPAQVRAFVSGTPLDSKDKLKAMRIVGLSGQALVKITNKDLIDRKISQKPIVKMYLVENQKMLHPTAVLGGYGYEVEQMMYCPEVINMVVEFCKERRDSQVVITFSMHEHGRRIVEALTPIYGAGNVGLVHGLTSDYDVERFKKGDIQVLVASTVLKEGMNIPNIRTMIRLHGGESVIDIKQFAGRGTRNDGLHDTVEFIDFYFLGKNVSKHSRARLRIYRKEGFEVNLMYDAKRDKPIKYPQF